MAADMTAAAAASAAAGTASALVGAMFGVPLDAIGCGLAGSFAGLAFVRDELSTAKAIGLFAAFGVLGAAVGVWATKDQGARNMVAGLVAAIGTPLIKAGMAQAGDVLAAFIARLKGAPK